MKKLLKFIICIFAIIGLLTTIIAIIEPYYFNIMKDSLSIGRNSRAELKNMVESNYGKIDDIEFFKGEAVLNKGDIIKIDNNKLYKLEFIDGNIERGWIDVVCYNPSFSSFLSLPQYALFEQLKFNKNTCYYIGSMLYDKEGECEYIPTQRFTYAGMYPYSVLKDIGDIQVKISEEKK